MIAENGRFPAEMGGLESLFFTPAIIKCTGQDPAIAYPTHMYTKQTFSHFLHIGTCNCRII